MGIKNSINFIGCGQIGQIKINQMSKNTFSNDTYDLTFLVSIDFSFELSVLKNHSCNTVSSVYNF
jgi:hypothetical protein